MYAYVPCANAIAAKTTKATEVATIGFIDDLKRVFNDELYILPRPYIYYVRLIALPVVHRKHSWGISVGYYVFFEKKACFSSGLLASGMTRHGLRV